MKLNNTFLFLLGCLLYCAPITLGQDSTTVKEPSAKSNVEPMRILLVAGGCCHDYATQTKLLKEGIEKRIHAEVTVVFNPGKRTDTKFEIYESDDWAKGYDVVVHDECSADVIERPYVDRILAAHKNGIPAVNLHCAMHSYRWGNFRQPVENGADNSGWYEMLGVQSCAHGAQSPIDVSFVASGNSIIEGLANWTTINEELYNNVRVFAGVEALAMGKQRQAPREKELQTNPNAKQTETNAVVAWTNHYGPNKTRIFCTTLGHNNETVGDARYLDLVTRGLLWATGRLETKDQTSAPMNQPAAYQPAISQRAKFNTDWKFTKGEIDAAQANGFDDRQWRTVELPHDWAIEGPFDVKYNARAGGLPFHGVGWYRKSFHLPENARGNQTVIEFDGAMNNSTVWINGHKLGVRPYGYVGFEYDLTPHLKFDGTENVIAVRLAPEDLSSRWYPGAGIYRNVYLETRNRVHVAHWGTFIRTPKVSTKNAQIELDVTVENSSDTRQSVVVSTEILDPAGNVVATMSEPCEVQAGGQSTITQTTSIVAPRLWDLATPVRYNARTSILANQNSIGVAMNTYNTPFGIRSIEFNASHGFLLNGRVVKIQGVCNHHDLGPLGAAVSRRATQRQIEIMKSMGVNSIRTSHNPPSPELVDLCDELGVLLQVEAFDCWVMPKVPNGYNKYFEEWHERDLRDMIKRDRNNPSVIMWSIGNEILEQGNKETGAGWARKLTAICKDEDPTRPVTAGFNYYPAAVENGLAAEIDLVGLNYKPAYYSALLKQHPDWIVYGSETASTVSSRGVYHFPVEKYDRHGSKQVTSYDFIGPAWAYPPEIEFDALAKNPQMFGEYIWTGFDYLGEPTPYGGRDNSTNGYWNDDWPAHGSYFGAVDLAGFPKDRFFLYQSQWTTAPMVHVLPHWNWNFRIGEGVPVYAYTNCEEVELFLNGKSLGRQKKGEKPVEVPVDFNGWKGGKTFSSKYRIGWDVPYQPGELTVRAYRGGVEVATETVRTAGKPTGLELQPDRQSIQGDGSDLSFVTVRIVDSNGVLCPNSDRELKFTVEGAGKLEALGSGNPISLESFQADRRAAFNGLALAIIRSKKDHSGAIVLTVTGNGLEPATVILQANSATAN